MDGEKSMKLLIGLGNPGTQFAHTRHNVGFLFIDALAKKIGIPMRMKRALEAQCGEGMLSDDRVLLCKPQTFMNASGRAIQKIMRAFPVEPADLIVIYDDADLSLGDVRFKLSGSSAGHRGMQSVLDQFPSRTPIARLRIGIGRPAHPDIPLDEFVLQRWSKEEENKLTEIIERALVRVMH